MEKVHVTQDSMEKAQDTQNSTQIEHHETVPTVPIIEDAIIIIEKAVKDIKPETINSC